MMLSKSLFAVAFAGAATAVTPIGFQPVSNADLIVVFGNNLALNGKSMTKAETAQAPTIGTTQRLMGVYAVMMVDPDIPPQTPGGATGELLHWMQQGLTSATTPTNINGMSVYVLSSATNESAFAPYFGPSPPNKAPNTHRYTQLLLDTSGTNNSAAVASLKQAAATRTNFNAINVVKAAGVPIVAGNSFNVSNGTSNGTSTSGSSGTIPAAAPINSATLVQANITKATPTAQQPGTAAATGSVPALNGTGTNGTGTNGTSPKPGTSGFGQSGGGAYVAGFIALAATLFLL